MTKVFAVVLAASMLAAFLAGVVGAFIFTAEGHDLRSDRQARHFVRIIADPIGAVMTVAAGAAMLLACRSLPREALTDRSPLGAAWSIGPTKEIAQGLGLGILAGLAISILSGHQARPHAYGLIKTVAAVALAPPVEEMLFRGLLYGGYRRSFGPVWATAVTTFLFCLPHATQMWQSGLAAIGITGMALAALWLRLHSASVGPAVAAHVGYNAAIAAVFLFFTP
ncbi:MAG: CPBP family intramembrane metalloprotease [Verrucomicrobia bacterium]|nr:CPBP family intramembrane metalloprotease [Verrucomicrobiota bacterium]